MNLKTRFITLTALGLLVLVAFSGALPAAHAQSSPSVAVSLSDASVEQGTAITATMSFTGLAFDSDTSTTDYTFRADVTGANDCEGGGLGRTRYMYRVDQDPEVRSGTISASCPAGDYTIRATISTPQSVALAAATVSFTVAAPAQEPTASPTASIVLSPSDAVGEGAEITATMSFGGLASDSDASTTDYVFRADVVDADDCEGGGIGFDRYMYRVDDDPETRTGTVSANCPAGAYTLRVSISSSDNTELASASADFFILGAPVLIEPPTLTALSVSHGDPAVDVTLSPAFESGTLAYRAAVRVAQVTVAPTASDADATVAYLDGNGDAIADADAEADGHQVSLGAGSNTVKVAVSRDGLITTYTVKLFRLVTQQQTANVTLVSNTGNAAAGGVAITAAGHKRAQQFTTGSNTGGYNLASVGVDIHTTPGDASGLVVTLRTEDSGNPSDTNPITLTTPATLTTGVNTFAAPANTVLSASTDYFIHLAYTGTGTDPQATWTRNDDQDGETGWSIRHGMHWYTSSWSGLTVPIKIQVTGSAVSGMPPPQSSDATLSALTLSAGTLRPDFASGTTEYRASVEHSVEQVTVTPTANAASPTIEYLDGSDAALADADSGTTGHQVTLAVGLTTFKVKVTDGTETETYRVVMERDSDQTWGWTPTRDFNTLVAAGNVDPKGIWGDATTLWVPDRNGSKLYAYTLETGVRDADKDFSLHSVNSSAGDIWSDGTTMWVLDVTDRRVYAYALSGGQRQDGTEGTTNKEFSLPSGSTPSGMWMDATTLWVSDNTDDKIFAYTRADGTRVSETTGGTTTYPKDVTLSGGNNNPSGLWSDGTTIWVADSFDKVVYAYTLATGVRDADSDLDLHSENTHVNGVWQGGTTMWVVDYNDDKLYAYNAPAQAVPPSSNAAPVFPAATVTLSVAENTAANTNIGNPVAATDDDAGDILTYSLEGTDGGSFGIVSGGQIQTSAALNYEAKSSYSVTVKVTDGTANVTKAVTISVTDVAEPPDQPAAPTVTAKGGTTDSLDVSWTAPANTGRPAIGDYNVQYRIGTTGPFTSHSFTGTGKSTTITGLTADTEYQVQVQAHNDEGDSPWSASGTGSTAPGADSVVTLNLDATTIAEDSGTAVNVTATLSAAKTTQFTVTVSAASPATDAAYTLSANTTLTFTANATESTGTVTITPVNNTDNERDKVITVSGAVAAGVTGVTSPADVTLTIEDDDHPVVTHTLTLHRNNAAKTLLDPTVIPENVGQVCVRVTATTESDLPPETDDRPTGSSRSDTAVSPGDFSVVSGQFYLPRSAYSLESGHHVAVRDDCAALRIVDDSVDEGNEQFALYTQQSPLTPQTYEFEFTPSNPLTVTIIDDDEASLSIADAGGAEGEDLEFTVTLDPTSVREVTVDWAVNDDSATAGADYTDGSGTLIFAPGDTTKTVTVATLQDTVPESVETFTVTLSNASNAAIGDARATGTITDDDEAAVSSDATLKRLRLSHTNISDFDSETTSYSVSLADSVVTVTPTANNEFAAIMVNGAQVASGSELEVDLDLGANTVTIEVTAQDGIATKTYTVTVTRHECPGQEVAGEFVTDATGCPRLTLLETGKVRVEWDAVTSGTTVTVRYFLNFVVTNVLQDGTKEKGKWFTKSDHYSGVTDSDASLTGETFSNLPLEANVVYFSYQTDGSAWSPWSMIWIDPQ